MLSYHVVFRQEVILGALVKVFTGHIRNDLY